jgi:hypothetical protein
MHDYDNYGQEIESGAAETGTAIRQLTAAEVIATRIEVAERFAQPEYWTKDGKLCEWLREPYKSTRYIDSVDTSWNIGSFAAGSPVIVFFEIEENRNQATVGYVLSEISKAIEILAECSSFSFYLTNFQFDYLIAYSEEEYIFAAGTAIAWFNSRFPSTPDSDI